MPARPQAAAAFSSDLASASLTGHWYEIPTSHPLPRESLPVYIPHRRTRYAYPRPNNSLKNATMNQIMMIMVTKTITVAMTVTSVVPLMIPSW